MKRIIIIGLLFLFQTNISIEANDRILSIIPEPMEITVKEGYFTFSEGTTVFISNKNLEKTFDLFKLFVLDNFKLELKKGNKKKSQIIIEHNPSYKQEDYKMNITSRKIEIEAGEAGVFYALQTLQQLMEEGHEITVPACEIKDSPRFSYRGLMLDVGRYFYPVEYVKQFIDMMSYYKFNVFHWHLTEDQGWRIEIKKYPELTKKGAWRNTTQVHRDKTQDNVPHGGYYTQEQIKDVIQYAADRKISVIPEIELPGHAIAALSVFPHLSCTGIVPTKNEYGVFPDIYCAGNEEVFHFLEDVLTEVVELFPSEYIHIGGDEAKKDKWEKCLKCQQRIKDLGLNDEKELQSYFTHRIEKFLNSKGKNIIGWDEILDGGLAPNATVMSWRGEKGGIAAAKQNHNVIMTPNSFLYFDYYQAADKSIEPYNHSSFLPLDSVYKYEPYHPSMTADQHKYIIGIQANLWTEYIHSQNKANYMLYPRALAAAEVAWSPAVKKNYDSFSKRLKKQLLYLDRKLVTFRIPEALVDRKDLSDNMIKIELEPLIKGAQIYYTINGDNPSLKGKLYSDGIVVDKLEFEKVRYIIQLPSGRESNIYTPKVSLK